MLKPFQELATPRHILQDSQPDDNSNPLLEKPTVLPTITLEHHHPHDNSNYFLVIPEVLSVLTESIFELKGISIKRISTIKVTYPDTNDSDNDTLDFDEATQLYNVKDNYILEQDLKDIPVYCLKTPSCKVDFVTIPSFRNKIIYNLLANTILSSYDVHRLITFGTCELCEEETVRKLISKDYHDSPTVLHKISDMVPPNIVTGIAGSFSSRAALVNIPFATIGVDAEGAFSLDMEKLNLDAVSTVAPVLNEMFNIDSTGQFLKFIESKLDLKRASNGGLYM
ncbi:hypothetical protein FOA43_000359 [Brettanomyces nanus]|uniref:Uncharacterized protein n=1 Tax=Eeniella nana TaxID=13502 RepID=A0A875RYC7_EENNA|nr:uncharacterized protein FOA43_000359 [Brettanomyces nanus]QPG73055.1 hypothetical protein FOA43_000359 [Brettanomyces nanus]